MAGVVRAIGAELVGFDSDPRFLHPQPPQPSAKCPVVYHTDANEARGSGMVSDGP